MSKPQLHHCEECGAYNSLASSHVHMLQSRLDKALKIIESHMPCSHGLMDNPHCPYCQIKLALIGHNDD